MNWDIIVTVYQLNQIQGIRYKKIPINYTELHWYASRVRGVISNSDKSSSHYNITLDKLKSLNSLTIFYLQH